MATKTKKFEGKIYHYHNVYFRKSDAKRVAHELRYSGYRARIVVVSGRLPSYEVYKRKQ